MTVRRRMLKFVTAAAAATAIGAVSAGGSAAAPSSLVRSITVQPAPIGITLGQSGDLWVASDFGSVQRVDVESGEVVATLTTGGDALGLATGLDGDIWASVANVRRVGNVVMRIDPATNRIVTVLPAGEIPSTPTVDEDGDVWVPNQGTGNTVTRIDPDGDGGRGAVVATISVPAGAAAAVALDDAVWVTTFRTAALSRIDRGDDRVTSRTMPGGNLGIAAGPGGDLWVTDTGTVGGVVWRIEPASDASDADILATVDLDQVAPSPLAFGVGDELWIGDNDSIGTVSRVDTTAGRDGLGAEVEVFSPVGSSLAGAAADEDGTVWFTSFNTSEVLGLGPAVATPRPFTMRLTTTERFPFACMPNPGQIGVEVRSTGEGRATHLGRVTVESSGCIVDGAPGEPRRIIDGRSVITAANGDRIRGTFSGTVTEENGTVTTVTHHYYLGGRGRFENAVGNALEHRVVDATTGAGTAEQDGRLAYGTLRR